MNSAMVNQKHRGRENQWPNLAKTGQERPKRAKPEAEASQASTFDYQLATRHSPRLWSMVAVECTGPTNAPEPDARPSLPPVAVPTLERLETKRVRSWVIGSPDRQVVHLWVEPTTEQTTAARQESTGPVAGQERPLVWYGNGMFYEYQNFAVAASAESQAGSRGSCFRRR